jgi:hypothetical protein
MRIDAVFLRSVGFGVGELRSDVRESPRKKAAIAIPNATATPNTNTHILPEIRSIASVLCKPGTIFKSVEIPSFSRVLGFSLFKVEHSVDLIRT